MIRGHLVEQELVHLEIVDQKELIIIGVHQHLEGENVDSLFIVVRHKQHINTKLKLLILTTMFQILLVYHYKMDISIIILGLIKCV